MIGDEDDRTVDIVLDQLLHGYSGGHRLIDGSRTLPDNLARLVQQLSDLSGTSVISGFEEYITGYPLVDIDAFALAKSWYAPEMPRPGCVWTHTIIIPKLVLSRLESIDTLKLMFKRPLLGSPTNYYSSQLHVQEMLESDPYFPESESLVSSILASHYALPLRPVLIPSNSSGEFEDLIFGIWTQKWPNLRMDFTFCTGALSARFLKRSPFEIQCVPKALSRAVYLEVLEATSKKPTIADSSTHVSLRWLEPATADLRIPNGGELRDFLFKVSDSTVSRSDFASLVGIFQALRETEDTYTIVESVGRSFPAAEAAKKLKQSLFGPLEDRAFLKDRNDVEILYALSTTQNGKAFDAEELLLKERGIALWKIALPAGDTFLGQLFSSSLNTLGEELLGGIVAGMEPSRAREFVQGHPRFLPSLFSGNSRLACSRELWAAGLDRRWELFDAVVKAKPELRVQQRIIRALLESGSDSLLWSAFESWGENAVFAALDWMTEHHGAISDLCREALSGQFFSVMSWVKQEKVDSLGAYATTIRIVERFVKDISNSDCAVWRRLFAKALTAPGIDHFLYVSAFLLALGLNNSQPSPLEFVNESFESLHEAAREERLSDDAWHLVEPYVPSLSWGKGWDKCERLRRGVVRACVQYRWPVSGLQMVMSNREFRQQLMKSAQKVERGEEIARELSRMD